MIVMSEALKRAVLQAVIEMLRHGENSRVVPGFPSTRVSFAKPNGNVFSVLQGKDLPGAGVRADQEVFVFQEG